MLHVLYFVMKECFKEANSDTDSEEEPAVKFSIPHIIPEDVARMAVHLTEYFQSQRLAYEKVSIIYVLYFMSL